MKTIKCGQQTSGFTLDVRATEADVVASFLYRVDGEKPVHIASDDNDAGHNLYTLPGLGQYEVWITFKTLEKNDPRTQTNAKLVIARSGGEESWRVGSKTKSGTSFDFDKIDFTLEAGQ